MSNSDEAAEAGFEDGLRQGLTWDNIGKQLASGALSGIASWAVGKLFDFLFSEGKSVEELLTDFKDQILAELPPIIRTEVTAVVTEEILRDNLREISANTEAVLRKFTTDIEAMSQDELNVCYNQINPALSQAKSLNVPGLGVYFSILPIYMAVCDAMVYKPPIRPEIPLERWKRRWYGYIEFALTEARAHHWNVRIDLYEQNASRVLIEQVRGPGEPAPGQRWTVTVDGIFKRFLSAEEELDRESVRRREISIINSEINQSLIHPAANIIFELEEYRANLLTAINTWMILRRSLLDQ